MILIMYKYKLIISFTNYARKLLNIDENLWVLISDENHFVSNEHSGLYDKLNFLIRYNKGWIKTASNSEIIKCAFHEVFHCLQHQELIKKSLGISSSIFTSEELEQMEFEFKDENYMLNNWENMLVEKQAEYFSD